MKLGRIKRTVLYGLMCLCFGGSSMGQAVQAKNLSGWITIRSEEAGFQASFPGKPIEMSFDLPFQNTPAKGSLRIYTYPMEKGVMILSILKRDSLGEEILREERFKQCVDEFLVKHLFQDPHLFHQRQSFKCRKTERNGIPLLAFQFSYKDGRQMQWMKGAAIVKNEALHTILYLAPKEGYDNELLEHFVEAFQFTDFNQF